MAKHTTAFIDWVSSDEGKTGRIHFCIDEDRQCPEQAAKELTDTAETARTGRLINSYHERVERKVP